MTLKDNIQAILTKANIQAGVAVWHIESGERTDVNGDVPYPMASTFKIPILATVFTQIKEGKLSLETRYKLTTEVKSPGSGILPYFEEGLEPTLLDMLTLMIIISDNTATDMIVDILGGPEVVESYMHQLGLTNIYFKMNCKNLIAELFPPDIRTLPWEEITEWSATHDVVRDGRVFSLTPDNDIATALDMNKLLHMIYKGELFDGELRETALGILFKQQFNVRMTRFFPPHIKVAHKTGTIGGIRNDSGIIYIDDDTHVILTLFVEWDAVNVWDNPEAELQRIFEVETAMGKIGQLVLEAYQ